MKKSLFLLIFSTIFAISIGYLIFIFYNFFNYDKITINKFDSHEAIIFHENYSKKLHHLRGGKNLIETKGNINEYLFTVVKDYKNVDNKILLQGHSWAEQLTNKERVKYYISRDNVKKKAEKNNFGFINAGISSFSPSLMKLQLDILIQDFDIKPNIIIAIIDQSDLGDENCRYKDKKIFKNSKLVGIKKDIFSDKIFNYYSLYRISEIVLENDNKLMQLVRITNHQIRYGLLTLFEKNYLKIQNLFTKKKFEYNKCYWADISDYLIASSENEINYFKNSLEKYINHILSLEHVDQLYIVTFPHKFHLERLNNGQKLYKHNVSNILDNLNIKNSKLNHINFTKMIKENKIEVNKDSFFYKDPASHLSDEYYGNTFINEILNVVNRKN